MTPNRIIYPNATAELAVLKTNFKQETDLLDTIRLAWASSKAKERISLLSSQKDRILKLRTNELKKFAEYLDNVIKYKRNPRGVSFIRRFDQCFINSDTQAQLGLLKYFYDQHQLRLLVAGKKVAESTSLQTISGTQYEVSLGSYMGIHTPGVNSDHYKIGKQGSPLIAAISDGCSGNIERLNNQHYTGDLFASQLLEQLELALDELFNPNTERTVPLTDKPSIALEQAHERMQELKTPGGATLSYAVDLGDKISFVSKGDSIINVIKKDRSVITLCGGDYTIAQTTTLPKAEIDTFMIMSDGLKTIMTSLANYIKQGMITAEDIVRLSLYHSSFLNDDKTIIVVKIK